MSYWIFNKIGDGTACSGFLFIGTIIILYIDHNMYGNGRVNLEKLQDVGHISGKVYVRTIVKFDIIRKIKRDQQIVKMK